MYKEDENVPKEPRTRAPQPSRSKDIARRPLQEQRQRSWQMLQWQLRKGKKDAFGKLRLELTLQ